MSSSEKPGGAATGNKIADIHVLHNETTRTIRMTRVKFVVAFFGLCVLPFLIYFVLYGVHYLIFNIPEFLGPVFVFNYEIYWLDDPPEFLRPMMAYVVLSSFLYYPLLLIGSFAAGISLFRSRRIRLKRMGNGLKVFVDFRGYVHTFGVRALVRNPARMLVAPRGLVFRACFGVLRLYPREDIAAIGIERKRRFLFPTGLIHIETKQENGDVMDSVLCYQPGSLKKILAALKAYGYGDMIIETSQ